MNKIVYLVAAGLISCQAFALEITSDVNGPVTLVEPQLNMGALAPKIALVDAKFKPQDVGGVNGKVQIISTIESFDTEVCDIQTMKFDEAAKKLPDVEISVISANLPFIIDNFQNKHKVKGIKLLSSFNNEEFGKQYGVQVVGGELKGILARSVFVVDKKGRVIYKEITSNIDKMPNLDAAISAARNASENT
ncbi:MAG: thiol peroxidase [Legionella sp.]|nr:MAG: thiol peroxidase [Legionella sp.]